MKVYALGRRESDDRRFALLLNRDEVLVLIRALAFAEMNSARTKGGRGGIRDEARALEKRLTSAMYCNALDGDEDAMPKHFAGIPIEYTVPPVETS